MSPQPSHPVSAHDASQTLSADHIRGVVHRYASLMTAGDVDGIVALYSPDAVVRDPADAPPLVGHDAIRTWYEAAFDALGGAIQMTVQGNVRVTGRHGAATLLARTVHHDPVLETETLDVMTFDDDGLVTALDAYWGPTNQRFERARATTVPSGSTAFDFTGAQVLVTGGSNGIGLSIARAFRAAGATVTITGTKADPRGYDNDLQGFRYEQLLLSDAASIQRLAGSLPGLDILVNNAGQNLPGGRSEWEPEVFEEVLATNLTGTYRLTAACKSLLFASQQPGGAAVINLGSMTSYFGLEVTPAYGAAKAAIVQLTKGLAVSWARKGVRVNAIAPGLVETNMTRPMLQFDEATAPVLQRTPMRRIGSPADIAPAVLFLCSDASGFVTGQTLPVDGGFSVQG